MESVDSEKKFSIYKLNKSHQRQLFSCGVKTLDDYIHAQAGQDKRKHISMIYVLNDEKLNQIAGYYTLSFATIELISLPDKFIKQLPNSPLLPATLIGRLAVDMNYQRKGLGEVLLMDALRRAYEASLQIASFAVVVEAISSHAVKFYEKYNFISFLSHKSKLYLPMRLINKLKLS